MGARIGRVGMTAAAFMTGVTGIRGDDLSRVATAAVRSLPAARFAFVLALCNMSDHKGRTGGYQLVAAHAVMRSLNRTGSHMVPVCLTHGFGAPAMQLLRQFGCHVLDVSDEPANMHMLAHNDGRAKWPSAGRVQLRLDFVATGMKFHAWELTMYDRVIVSDSDMCILEDPEPWMAAHLDEQFVAPVIPLDQEVRGFLGISSHYMLVRPSLQVARILKDMGRSGGFVPYTNSDQDVIETVFPAHAQHGVMLPKHAHQKDFAAWQHPACKWARCEADAVAKDDSSCAMLAHFSAVDRNRLRRAGARMAWAARPKASARPKAPLAVAHDPDELKQAPSSTHIKAKSGCRVPRTLSPIRSRSDLGSMLRALKIHGRAAELGVLSGKYTTTLLEGWQSGCDEYVQVDAWTPMKKYLDKNNAGSATHLRRKAAARTALHAAVKAGWARSGHQCHNYTDVCAARYPDGYFSFVYVDARHDYKGVMRDLALWWPKLKLGGLMAGHDYSWQKEPPLVDLPLPYVKRGVVVRDPERAGDNWTVNFDGSLNSRAVKGAVDDFFSGEAPESPEDLRGCPTRQLMITYRELGFNTWVVAK